MFANMLGTTRALASGASGSASAGAFGAGGSNFLGGQGTALGMREFSPAQAMGGQVSAAMGTGGNGGVDGGTLQKLLDKMQNMTPEESANLATTMASVAAPPAQGAMQAPMPSLPQSNLSYADFVNPGAKQAAPVMRTPLGIGG